jgi:8-oxo-dGTP pyrophosphatase MutT (NUDIX family)
MGAGALFRANSHDGVLLVKPSYKPTWEIPGGMIEVGESPRTCCKRELREELGVDLPIGRLLIVDWLPPTQTTLDGWMFVYDGGILNGDVTSRIVLPSDELVEWRLVGIGELDQYLPAHMARRIRVAHRCAIDGTTMDLESGVLSEGSS